MSFEEWRAPLTIAGNSLSEKRNLPISAGTPRIVIGAPQGRSGKTTVALILAGALTRRGLKVGCFKKGPDYIDPSWLRSASGQECHNLDSFIMSKEAVKRVFVEGSSRVDIALVEGSMGLFDGYGEDRAGTVADLAHLIEAPIILVVNAARMTQSIAPMVKGFQHFEPQTAIAGVVLNNVSGPRHREKLTRAVEIYCGIPVLGILPKRKLPLIGERHLGLIPTEESPSATAILDTLAAMGEQYMNLEGIEEVARRAPQLAIQGTVSGPRRIHPCRIGVIRDRAFSFYYPENLDALRAEGGELVFIDTLADTRLPYLDGLYIGGGFPELYAAELEANRGLRMEIAHRVEGGMPVYAECAGLMYLCKSIVWRGRTYEMVGTIPADLELVDRPLGHGYVEVEVTPENPLFDAGSVLRGHEFHHSRLIPRTDLTYGYRVRRGHGIDGTVDGVCYGNVFAAYTHLHALGTPVWAKRFVAFAAMRVSSSVGEIVSV
jgi:cobyrinic acid a,c-diamide synthase